jgi:hypothetical protein
MDHCDTYGWDGPEPVLADEPSVSQDLLWTLRVCPRCGAEVYGDACHAGAHLCLWRSPRP